LKSVIMGTGYILVHVPDMVVHSGTTQTTERIVNPNSEYLKQLPGHIRSYADAAAYLPNQVYIGTASPDALAQAPQPWYGIREGKSGRFGPFGEIMPQDEFLLLMQACDAFDLVFLGREFVEETKQRFAAHPLMGEDILARVKEGADPSEIDRLVAEENAEPLYHMGKTVGCVKKAHDVDSNLSAHVIHENLVSKASCVLSLLHVVRQSGIDKGTVDYVIDCSEEACGDMNQRGGGNFAKAAADVAGLTGASGCDIRAFCAAPAHAVIHAASLVSAGVYENVIVAAGGSTAKLGMNGKDHIKKGLPILEDVLGGFAVLISKNDGMHPEVNTDIVGNHKVGTGSSPQAVISSLVTAPLNKVGMKILDVDKYAVEMQNPEITKSAGAGDIPLSNYKMIAALAVMQKEIERSQIDEFTQKHGMVGWAPTQGHIPSGVPYLGFACRDILAGKIKNAMIIGKGSLFLGRMTNLFDGISFMLCKNTDANGNGASDENNKGQKNPAETGAAPFTGTTVKTIVEPVNGLEAGSAGRPARIAVVGMGSELGEQNVLEGVLWACKKGMEVLYIGTLEAEGIQTLKARTADEAFCTMEKLLDEGKADGAVAMHYLFPVGVSTVGRALTPGQDREMYIATTTGTASLSRVEGMVKNAIYGIIAAKTCGIANPTVGILNIDGARQTESALKQLKQNGYDIAFASSGRADGGCVMRGNDLLSGACDVMVCDPLTGNILMKTLSAYTTGGSVESTGWGYGPGIGEGYGRLVAIVSRASGAPVVAGAIEYTAQMAEGKYKNVARAEFEAANRAGLKEILEGIKAPGAQTAGETKAPPKEVVTEQISGIEIMDLEEAVRALWAKGIYAESGMGCTGPAILVAGKNIEKAMEILLAGKWLAE